MNTSRARSLDLVPLLAVAVLGFCGCGSQDGGEDGKCGNGEIDQFESCDGSNLNNLTCEDLEFAGGTLGCTAECQLDTGGCLDRCGDGQLDPGEECDADNLNGKDCTDMGFTGGTLSCGNTCSFDTSLCEQMELCGNGLIDDGEDCDGQNLNDLSCEGLGYTGGALACSDTCAFDRSDCQGSDPCGNQEINYGEECDGDELSGLACEDMGFTGGSLSCDASCRYDTSGCDNLPPCGNGVIDTGEDCDGAELDSLTCADLGFWGGVLVCSDSCEFDTSGCVHRCGNGAIDEREDCDGADLNDLTCLDLGYTGGTLECSANCLFDTGACEGSDPCGNGQIDYGEDCDGVNLNDKTCETLGYFTGDLACDADCKFDTVLCTNCGNDLADPGEACDGTDLSGLTCQDLGYTDGTLICAAECLFEVSGCSGCADDAHEENDDQQNAAPLTGGFFELRLCNETGGEQDWFSIGLQAGDTLAVVVDFSNALLDLDLQMLDGSSVILDSSDTTGDRETMLYTTLSDQTVFVWVFPYEDAPGVVAYSMNLVVDPDCQMHSECPDGQLCDAFECVDFICGEQNECPDGLVCHLGSCVECATPADCPSPQFFLCQDNACVFNCQEDVFEPNSEAILAAPIALDFVEIALTLCGENDEDWFQVDLVEDGLYDFDFAFTQSDGNIDVQLFTAADTVNPVASGTSTTDDESFSYLAPEGTAGPHLIRIWLATNGAYGQTYDMAVIRELTPECNVDEDCLPSQICIDNSCVDVAQGDLCGYPVVVDALPHTASDVDMTQFTAQLEFDSSSCTSFGTAGRDAVYQLTLLDGQTLQASLTSTFDGALYVVNDCSVVPIPAATACLAGSDAQGQNGTEDIQYSTEMDMVVYVVVDHYSAGGPASGSYTLQLQVQ